MKLEAIQNSIRPFVEVLNSREGMLHMYKYDMLENFRAEWTFDSEDFAGMYDQALQSHVTRRWWKRDNYRPKEMMLLFIGAQEHYVRQAFKELLNESKSVENRIDSFGFYCDELLRMYRKAFPKSIVNNHYQDSAMLSLYLSAMYPERYTLYPGRDIFNKALKTLQAKQTEGNEDLFRFFKVCNTLSQFLTRDPAIHSLIEAKFRPRGNLLLVHEYLYFIADEWTAHVP